MTIQKVQVLAGCGLAALLAAGMWGGCSKAEKKAGPTLVEVKRGNLRVAVAATGLVEPEYTVDIKSKASGEVEEVFVQEGDQVKKGDALVKINPILETRRVNQAQSEVRMAKAKASSAWLKHRWLNDQIKVQQELLKKGLVPGSTLAELQKDVGMQSGEGVLANAQLAKAEEALAEAKDRLAETSISSPTAGTVIERQVQPGQVVTSGTSSVSGGTTLLQIANLERLFITVKVDEADVTKLQREQNVVITADATLGRRFRGKVLRIAPKGSVESNITVFDVVVAADDKASKALRPQMSANVEIVVSEKRDALLVPQRALELLGRDAQRRPEYVVRMAGGEKRPVTVGLIEAGQAEILSGLSEGDTIQLPATAARRPATGQRRGGGVPGVPGAPGQRGGGRP